MKDMRNAPKRGAKLEPQPTNSQRIRELDTTVQNLQVAGRITQMMVQKLLENFQSMNADLGKAYNIINELQYKVLAMQSLGAFDKDALAKTIEELRLKDFNEACDAADARDGFTVGDVVESNSTVIITSTTTNGEEGGIFRSRIELATCGVPALIEGLIGKPVGTKVTCQLNGVEHVVELLGIRNPPPPVPVEQETTATGTVH